MKFVRYSEERKEEIWEREHAAWYIRRRDRDSVWYEWNDSTGRTVNQELMNYYREIWIRDNIKFEKI